jgi:hypothetical protein
VDDDLPIGQVVLMERAFETIYHYLGISTAALGFLVTCVAGVWAAIQARQSSQLKTLIEDEMGLVNRRVSDAGAPASTANLGSDENTDLPEQSDLHGQLLRRYHAQGLAQSQVSFWFSIVFAALGFSIIAFGAVTAFNALVVGGNMESLTTGAVRASIPIISGTVIDAVAALFFVQSNRARHLMSAFFDKLRTDNNLSIGLRLAEGIPDKTLASSLQAYLAMHFSGIDVSVNAYRSVLGLPIHLSRTPKSSPKPKEKSQNLKSGRPAQTTSTEEN